MKFLHTGDLHLDSAFCASSPTEANARRQRQREVLKKIFNTAKEEDCDMVLIAGDLFDTSFVTPETRELCIKLFSEFEKPVIISPGNHDPFVEGSFYKSALLPENAYVFSSFELQYFDFPELNTTVAGFAFTDAVMFKNPLEYADARRENERVLLLCAHADLDTPTSRYAPIFTSDIEKQGFDYAALGHIHNIPQGTSHIRYCGFPEGRSFDEQGDGGVLIVTADGVQEPLVERKIISDICYLSETLSVNGMSAQEIHDKINTRLKEIADNGRCALRIELMGILSTDDLTDISSIEQSRPKNIISLEIINSALCIPDRERLEKDITLRGEFYRSLRDKLMSEDREERRTALTALKIGLCAIDGKDFTDNGGAL